MTTTITPRPVAEVLDDIRRYGERLTVNCVIASSHWYNETTDKLNAAKAELVAAKHRIRVERDAAARLAAVQHIAPRVAGRAGAR
jgi:hypothetical protein